MSKKMSKTMSKKANNRRSSPTTTTPRQQQDLPKGSNKESMKYGMDIGGVLRNQSTGLAIEGGKAAVQRIIDAGHSVHFISKCGPSFMDQTRVWLAEEGLSHIPIEFCATYPEKILIADRLGLDAMIDDKVTVLKHFPPSKYRLIWFCDEKKNIDGLQKHDPAMFASLMLVRSWDEFSP